MALVFTTITYPATHWHSMIWSILLTSSLLDRTQAFALKNHAARAHTFLLHASSSSPAPALTDSLCDFTSANISRRHCLNKLTSLAINGGLLSALPPPTNAQVTELPERSKHDLKQQEMDLWNKVNQRRPSSYTQSEIEEIDTLIDEISSSAHGSIWQRDLLPGKWRVAYIRPGQGGGGLDRRIPFPELPFNESYQKFTMESVTNVGELLGPAVRVEVGGGLTEDDLTVDSTPKRFRADITRGDLCAGNVCVKLPIEGVGLFDGVYLGEQIRIGQNLNESGALVVQVRSKI